MMAGSLCVEIKYHTFVTASHQMPLDPPINTADGIYESACLLFSQLWDGAPIRLLGIRSSKLLTEGTPVQMSLFDQSFAKTEKQRRLDSALDSIRRRFGEEAVVRGSQLKEP